MRTVKLMKRKSKKIIMTRKEKGKWKIICFQQKKN